MDTTTEGSRRWSPACEAKGLRQLPAAGPPTWASLPEDGTGERRDIAAVVSLVSVPTDAGFSLPRLCLARTLTPPLLAIDRYADKKIRVKFSGGREGKSSLGLSAFADRSPGPWPDSANPRLSLSGFGLLLPPSLS